MINDVKRWKPDYWRPPPAVSDRELAEMVPALGETGVTALFLKGCAGVGNDCVAALTAAVDGHDLRDRLPAAGLAGCQRGVFRIPGTQGRRAYPGKLLH